VSLPRYPSLYQINFPTLAADDGGCRTCLSMYVTITTGTTCNHEGSTWMYLLGSTTSSRWKSC